MSVQGVHTGECICLVEDVQRRLSYFVQWVVVHRRDEVIRGWRTWLREDPLGHPKKWLRADLVPPAPFLRCDQRLTPSGSGVLADHIRIEEFRKPWLPYFSCSGQREASLEEFALEVDGWLPVLPVVDLPQVTGEMLEGVVRRKCATAGSLEGWDWRELKVLPVAWCDERARILTKVEELGVWPDVLLDAYIAMIPNAGGDAAPSGQQQQQQQQRRRCSSWTASDECFLWYTVFGLLPGWCSLRIGSRLRSRIRSCLGFCQDESA